MANARIVALVAVFSALNFAVAALNRMLPFAGMPGGISPGHMVFDAITCTAVMLTAACAVGRFGVASLMGVVTGLLMVFAAGAKPPALVSWPVRGLVLDLVVYKGFRGAVNLKSCCSAAFLAFLLQTVVGKVLFLLIFMPAKVWVMLFGTLFLPMTLVGSAVSLTGGFLAARVFVPAVRGVSVGGFSG